MEGRPNPVPAPWHGGWGQQKRPRKKAGRVRLATPARLGAARRANEKAPKVGVRGNTPKETGE